MNQDNSSQSVTPSVHRHRAFYALQFSPEVTAYLHSIIDELRLHGADVRWVREQNLHLTLRFLGELTDEQLHEASRLVISGEEFKPMQLAPRGLGAFPMLRAAKVLWTGVAGESQTDKDHLHSLQRHTERAAQQIGLPPENRPYRAHITLGRVARPTDGLRALIDDLIGRDCSSPFCGITKMVLMESHLSGEGSDYRVVA